MNPDIKIIDAPIDTLSSAEIDKEFKDITHYKTAKDINGNEVVVEDRIERVSLVELKAERDAIQAKIDKIENA